jgi:hypothetical protein
MNELRIINKENEETIVISKSNNILYEKLSDILYFYKLFDSVINEKNDDISITMGNKTINSKDFILINLFDIQSLIDSIKYKKGSLLYKYVNNLITESSIDLVFQTNNYIENMITPILKTLPFNYYVNFSSDISNIFNNNVEFTPIINDKDINTYIEKILNELMGTQLNKVFILFINSDLIDININDNDNLYLFDISKNKKIDKYNILITNNSINNFDYEMLKNRLALNWPINYNEEKLIQVITNYFTFYFQMSEIYTNNSDILIISTLMNNYYNLQKNIKYNAQVVDNIVKSFLIKFT